MKRRIRKQKRMSYCKPVDERHMHNLFCMMSGLEDCQWRWSSRLQQRLIKTWFFLLHFIIFNIHFPRPISIMLTIFSECTVQDGTNNIWIGSNENVGQVQLLFLIVKNETTWFFNNYAYIAYIDVFRIRIFIIKLHTKQYTIVANTSSKFTDSVPAALIGADLVCYRFDKLQDESAVVRQVGSTRWRFDVNNTIFLKSLHYCSKGVDAVK